MDRSVLARKPMTELKDIASHLNLRGYQKLRKAELIDAIISGGTQGAADPDAGDAPAQQQLTTDQRDTGSAEGSQGRAERTREESARKVLPPAARQAEAPGLQRDRERDDADDVARARDDGDDDRGTGRNRDRSDGTDQDRTDRDRTEQDRAEQDRTERDRTERDRAERDRTDRDRAERPQRDQPAPERRPDRDRPEDRGDDGEEDDEEGRTRRSRRDRRKRNRDRDEDGPSGDTAAKVPPSGNEPGEVRAGVLDILPEGYGFLRTTGYTPGERDVYVSQGQIRKHGLRRGDVVQGPIRQQRSNEKVPALHHLQRVNGDELQDGRVADRPDFDQLTPVAPDERIVLGGQDAPPSALLIDLFAPIGRGQRALLVAPPRSGKTRLLRELGAAVANASPDAHLMAVLVDERPEEITETARTLPGEVIASAFDQPAEDHAQIADLALERARRLVELGHDVIVLLDSATRLARAHGVLVQGSGRTIAPGVEAAALYPVKRFLAAARNTEEAGSLTVIATILDGTAAVADQVVLDELLRVAGTVVRLDPVLVSRRVHPPIDVLASGTDDEQALQDDEDLAIIRALRRALDGLTPAAATELLLDKLAQAGSVEALLSQISHADVTADARPPG